jgi:hypothetical protein
MVLKPNHRCDIIHTMTENNNPETPFFIEEHGSDITIWSLVEFFDLKKMTIRLRKLGCRTDDDDRIHIVSEEHTPETFNLVKFDEIPAICVPDTRNDILLSFERVNLNQLEKPIKDIATRILNK